jgi:NAD(P)-dependent dehydrogenase (short-subunit alcohol dehydrogenase family)
MNLDLDGRRALVTGGTRGLGRAIAEALVAEGVQVVVSGASPDSCATAQQELAGRCHVVRADNRDLEATKELVREAESRLGGLDILVNNAGRFAGGSLKEISDEEWLREIDTKLLGAIRTTREALPLLLEGGGSIVNIAGGSAHTAGGIAAISGVNNSGMINFTAFLAREFGPQGVRAVAVAPGMTLTASWQARAQAMADERGITVEEALAAFLAMQNAGHARWVLPKEIGELVTFLASDRAAIVSGTTVRANAGQSSIVS